jgi:hypothetical protein
MKLLMLNLCNGDQKRKLKAFRNQLFWYILMNLLQIISRQVCGRLIQCLEA